MYWHHDSREPIQARGVPRRGRRRTGAFLVEFAIVAPIMFMLMLATFEFGRAFMVMELLTEGARVGARQGIIDGTTTDQIRQAVVNYLTAVGIKGDTVTVQILYDAPNPLHPDINVQVTVPISDVSWVPNPLFTSGTLSGQFTMRQE
jgi:Flp pilus assembly protein TadG